MREKVGAAAAAVTAAALLQKKLEARDRRASAAPGVVVELDDVRVHAVVEGWGPTVFIDSGLGGSTAEWETVAADLKESFTVVRYDRPGFGWSPPATCDRSSRSSARRMQSLLKKLGVATPCILVGHSLGGLHARVLAALYPDLAAGLVLVDPSHEDMLQDQDSARGGVWFARALHAAVVCAPLGTPQLITRAYGGMLKRQLQQSLDEATIARMAVANRLTLGSVGGLRAVSAELSALRGSLNEARHVLQANPLPAVPITVISAAGPTRNDNEAKARRVINQLHDDLVTASPLGRHVLAERSGHLVPLDQPEVIVRSVRELQRPPMADPEGADSARTA